MKKTENIQIRLSDGGRINIRVTPEGKEKIRSKATAQKSTMSAFILNSLEKSDNPISVNLDNSDLRELIIQVRRINSNVRSLFKNVEYSKHFTFQDEKKIEEQLIRNEEAVLAEQKRVKELVSKVEGLSKEEAVKFAKRIKDEKLGSINDFNEY